MGRFIVTCLAGVFKYLSTVAGIIFLSPGSSLRNAIWPIRRNISNEKWALRNNGE